MEANVYPQLNVTMNPSIGDPALSVYDLDPEWQRQVGEVPTHPPVTDLQILLEANQAVLEEIYQLRQDTIAMEYRLAANHALIAAEVAKTIQDGYWYRRLWQWLKDTLIISGE